MMTPEAKRVANFLAAMPNGHTTMKQSDAASLLLETGGQLMARGRLYDIDAANIGAGVWRVRLKDWQGQTAGVCG